MQDNSFLGEHLRLTRRYFMGLGVAGAVMIRGAASVSGAEGDDKPKKPAKPDKAGAKNDPYFTRPTEFRDVSRGKPVPHSLSEEQKREVGLTRETWKLEVVSDTEKPARLGKTLTKADGTALDFDGLMKL